MNIASSQIILNTLDEINSVQSAITQFMDSTDRFISELQKNPTVISFYESGQYGKSMEEKMRGYQTIIKSFSETLLNGNGLIPQSRIILKRQLDLLNRRAGGE